MFASLDFNGCDAGKQARTIWMDSDSGFSLCDLTTTMMQRIKPTLLCMIRATGVY